MPGQTKTCIICGLVFPATDYYFYTTTVSGKKYLRSACKECCKGYSMAHYRAYYDNNREAINKKARERWQKKKDRIK